MKNKKIERAIKNGLSWCVDFFHSKRNFVNQSPNLVMMLMSMLCCSCKENKSLIKILEKLLIDTLNRASLLVHEIFKVNDKTDIYIFLSACRKIKKKYCNNNTYNRFISAFKQFKKKDIELHDQDVIKTKHYDKISDMLMEYIFMKMARNGVQKKIKRLFPRDRSHEYLKVLKKININITEKNWHKVGYHLTHVIYVYNEYNCRKFTKEHKHPEWIRQSLNQLTELTNKIYKKAEIDLIAETLEVMSAMKNKKWLKKNKKKFVNKILQKQRKDGAWYTSDDHSLYDKFHGTWTCLNALYI